MRVFEHLPKGGAFNVHLPEQDSEFHAAFLPVEVCRRFATKNL